MVIDEKWQLFKSAEEVCDVRQVDGDVTREVNSGGIYNCLE